MSFYISNLEVNVSFYFWLVMSFLCFYTDDNIIIASIFFVLLHELAHIVMLLLLKQRIQKIILLPFGVKICKNDSINCSYINEFFIFIAGVLVNFLLFILFLFLYNTFYNYEYLIFSSINLALCIFNLLPVSVLDGGNLLRLFTVNVFGLSIGEYISNKVSVITSIFIFIFTIYCNIYYNVSFSLVITSFYLFLSNFSLLHKV